MRNQSYAPAAFLLASVFLSALLLTGCAAPASVSGASGGEAERREETFFAMDTIMEFAVYGEEANLQAARSVVEELEARLSADGAGSEIAQLNREGRVVLSPETAALLRDALNLCEKTRGALDISIYPAVQAWGFVDGANQEPGFRVPSFDETDLLTELVESIE